MKESARGTAALDLKEADIQALIVSWLSIHAPQGRGFLFFSVPNEGMGESRGRGGLARMARLRRMGLRPGVADLVIVKGGRAYFLELKRRAGRQSVNQLEFEADAIHVGAEYAVARSFEEAQNIVISWGIVPGDKGEEMLTPRYAKSGGRLNDENGAHPCVHGWLMTCERCKASCMHRRAGAPLADIQDEVDTDWRTISDADPGL